MGIVYYERQWPGSTESDARLDCDVGWAMSDGNQQGCAAVGIWTTGGAGVGFCFIKKDS